MSRSSHGGVLKACALQRLPVLKWAPKYNSQKLVNDAIAGITVALTAMPQALAYATLAGLEPQYGLYSSFLGCFVYIIFGTCKEITIGPTALMALMTYEQIHHRNVDYAVLLCFLSGVVQLLMAVLNLGILVDFISIPVTVGFTSATSVIVISSQLKSLLGLTKISTSNFFDTIASVYRNIGNARVYDCALSFTSVAILILLKKLKDANDGKTKRLSTFQRFVSNALWIISTSRNALVVIFSSVMAYYFCSTGVDSPFLLTGSVVPGFPDVKPPPFSTVANNRTVGFTEMLNDLGSSVLTVPIVAVLANVAIAKAFASGQSFSATQELFTLSLINVFGSFFSSMPVTGSFSRSAVNHASGVQTPLGGLFTGVIVIMALTFLTPYFAYIPKASLAAVIICAVIFMIEYEVVKPMWRSSKKDLVPTFLTFALCLVFGVEFGILIGVAVNVLFLLHAAARPSIKVEKLASNGDLEYILVTPASSLYFPAVDFIRSGIGRAGLASSHLPVVVDCRFILGADFTAVRGIEALIKQFDKRKQALFFLNPQEEVLAVFKGALNGFVYFSTVDEMHESLKNTGRKALATESSRLLENVEHSVSFDKNRSVILKIRETDTDPINC